MTADSWAVAGARVVVDNTRSSFHGDHGEVIRPVSYRRPDRPVRLVRVRLDESTLGDVEFAIGELRPETST